VAVRLIFATPGECFPYVYDQQNSCKLLHYFDEELSPNERMKASDGGAVPSSN
jgi:hypothetical protein